MLSWIADVITACLSTSKKIFNIELNMKLHSLLTCFFVEPCQINVSLIVNELHEFHQLMFSSNMGASSLQAIPELC